MSNLQVNIQDHEDDRVIQKYVKNEQDDDNNNDEIQTHDAHNSGNIRTDEATGESVREKKPFALSTPSVLFMKETSTGKVLINTKLR